MDDDRLRDALRALPRDAAPPGFTARVLDRLREPRRVRPVWAVPARVAVAVAAVLAVLAAGVGYREWSHEQERRAALARIATLRAEQRALEAELAALRRLAAESQGVVYLGRAADVDLVFDVGRLADARRARAENELEAGSVRPATLHRGGNQL